MPPESPSLLLQRAAEAIEECAGKATPGPWRAAGGFGTWRISVENPPPDEDHVCYDITRVDDADWIAAMSPAVAAPLVAWLRAIAANMTQAGIGEDWARAVFPPEARAALDFARLVLGLSVEEETTGE